MQDYFWQHFMARALGLILLPFIIYLSFFYVHFAVLTQSGTGDAFMSPAFQETLAGNEMLLSSAGKDKSIYTCFSCTETALEIRYFDTVTLKHRDTKAFLHSHAEKYPLTYEDGRISSAGMCHIFLFGWM